MLVLAYQAMARFLEGPITWDRYEETVLATRPGICKLHKNYGLIDLEVIKESVNSLDRDKYRRILAGLNPKALREACESTIAACHAVLRPLMEVDVCLFRAVLADCVCWIVDGKQVVMISVEYGQKLLPQVLVHEYAHALDGERHPKRYKGSLISEGFACYFLKSIQKNCSIYDALWMIPRRSVDWCIGHESDILAEMAPDLDNDRSDLARKYMIDGIGFASPPPGFPAKTGYYIGYRVVERAIQGISVEELLALDQEEIIRRSGLWLAQ